MNDNILEVNLDNISYNIQSIQEKIGKDKIQIPVIKADAYGLGAVALKPILEKNNIKIVAVATIGEAIELRNNNFNMQILVLNEILENNIQNVIKYDLTVGISNINIAKDLNKEAEKNNYIAKVHIKVDTGMGRTGLSDDQVVDFAKILKDLKNIEINGIYTHLSSANSPDEESKEYTREQIEAFAQQVDNLNKMGIKPDYVHVLASAGIILYNDDRFNSVRPGIILYGYNPEEINDTETLRLKPALTLKSKIGFIKEVPEGKAISYYRTYVTDKKTKIATVGMGYADGMKRDLSNNFKVLVDGKYAPIIGKICMDNFMIDITDIPEVKIGDDVIIWDNKNITLEDITKSCKTIKCDILCGISKRVERKYI